MVERFYNNFFLRFYNAHPALFSIFLISLGYSIFNINDALVKHVTHSFTLFEIIFWNGLFSFITINVLAFVAGYKKSLHSKKTKLHALRGCIAFIGSCCVVLALSELELATFYAIAFLSPIVCVLFARMFFKDHLGTNKIMATVLGFFGILFIAQPENLPLGLGLLAALGLVFTHSISMMIVRKIGKDEPKLFFSFMTSLIVASLSLTMCLVEGTLKLPDAASLSIFASIGFCAALAGTAVSTSFQIAPSTSTVAPFHYVQMVWGVLIGIVFWHEIPSLYTTIGSLIVIASGAWIILLEKGQKSPIAAPLEEVLENSVDLSPSVPSPQSSTVSFPVVVCPLLKPSYCNSS